MRRHAKAIVATSALLLTLALSATLASAVAPVVTVEDASNVSYTSADVKGTVNPEGQSTTWRFQYITEALFHENLSNSLPGFEGASTGIEGSTEAEETLERQLTGLQLGTIYHLRLQAENGDGQSEAVATNTFTTKAVGPAIVSIDPVTTFTGTTAHFSGTIDPEAPEEGSGEFPEAFDVTWHFECTPECPGLPGNKTIPADSDPHEVEADATGLEPNTSYEVRLVAGNQGGSVSDETSFTTPAVAPVVKTLPPAVITDTSAWIGGKVDPQNTATTYYIEYSTDPGFAGGIKVPASEDGDAGSGSELVLVNHHAEGLEPGTTYYYRVVAAGAGTATGATETVTTRSDRLPSTGGLPDGRVYEKVSPSDKRGAEIFPAPTGDTAFEAISQASLSGDQVAYSSFANFAGDGAPPISQYLARRQPDGKWATEGLSPRSEPFPFFFANFISFSWLSEDLSKGVVAARAALNPDDPGGRVSNLYLRDNEDNTYRLLNDGSPPPLPFSHNIVRGVTPSGSAAVFSVGQPGEGPLWEWVDGDVREVGILPDGTSTEAQLGADRYVNNAPGQNALSESGKRVYFHLGFSQARYLYLRDFTSGTPTTILVSASERAGDDPTQPVEADFELASADGSVAIFASGRELTQNSTAPGFNPQNLYRWEADAQPGERLTDLTTGDPDGAQVFGTVGAAEDAETVYFVAKGDLAPGAEAGKPNLYLWQLDEPIRLVATLSPVQGGFFGWSPDNDVWSKVVSGAESEGKYREARVSPNGRYLAFASYEALTAYDTAGTKQVYLYDAVTGRTSCVSCGAVEASSHADSSLSSGVYESFYHLHFDHLPRNISADGTQVVFDSADALVPEDSNGATDVYRWRDGQIDLISSGGSAAPSRLLDVSRDGEDIFFTTRDKLAGSDRDDLADLYDARIDGVPEPAPDVPCVADECQGNPSAAPGFETPASAGFSAPASSPNPLRCRRDQRRVKVRGKARCRPRHKKRRRQATPTRHATTRKDG